MNRKEKKTYMKPKLRIIELAAEEVLGTGCKVSLQLHSNTYGCTTGYPGCTASNDGTS